MRRASREMPAGGRPKRVGRWTFDAAAGLWLFTTNHSYYPGSYRKSQDPLLSVQAHVSHTFPNRIWVGVHGAWSAGGDTRVQGHPNLDEQRNTRLGGTLSLPLARFHSIKVV